MFLKKYYLLMNKEGDDGGGGGANDDTNNENSDDSNNNSNDDDLKTQIAELKKQNESLQSQLKNNNAPPQDDDDNDDLSNKVRKSQQQKQDQATQSKNLENALQFNMNARDFMTKNEKLLPQHAKEIVDQADKENYDSAIDKANAIKTSLVSEFFAKQANLDLLTESQKNRLEEFKNLTKNEKEKRVGQIYNDLFEPTFENLKRIKRAEEVSKGHRSPSSEESDYNKRMAEISRKRYLGE